ncbi:hypothetical protein SAMN02799627_05511 [Methylobacterium sp. 13MFTsu3.1M2]|nr:hypothetical protein SAMN02799627_05511 [Methylobacterium sp. 13MFTsu3.1M2]
MGAVAFGVRVTEKKRIVWRNEIAGIWRNTAEAVIKFGMIRVNAAINNSNQDAVSGEAARIGGRGVDRCQPPISPVFGRVELRRRQRNAEGIEGRGRARRHGLRRHRSQSQRERRERAADQQSEPHGAAPPASGAPAPARITGSGHTLYIAILLDHRTDPRHACRKLCTGVRKCGFNGLSHCGHTRCRARRPETGIPLSGTDSPPQSRAWPSAAVRCGQIGPKRRRDQPAPTMRPQALAEGSRGGEPGGRRPSIPLRSRPP